MKKSALITLHLLFWIFTSLLITLVFQLILASSWILFQSRTGPTFQDNLKGLYTILPVGACIFYAAYFSFSFFAKRAIRFVWLAACGVLFIIAICVPGYLAQRAIHKGVEISHVQGILSTTFILSPVLYFIVLGFLFRAFIAWIEDRKIKAELEKDKLASQLELLTSKMNPHFLFNTLNNIDVLIQEEPAKASSYLKELSGILRFMLYESNMEKIPLEQEIAYIRKYIDLQKIRTSNARFVHFEIAGDAGNKYISPMILIHFIENAFKYAANKKIEDAITIRFEISETRLLFFCKNHIHATQEISGEKNGLGIALLTQKLDLLYKNTYTLHAQEENNWYIVTLELQLHEH